MSADASAAINLNPKDVSAVMATLTELHKEVQTDLDEPLEVRLLPSCWRDDNRCVCELAAAGVCLCVLRTGRAVNHRPSLCPFVLWTAAGSLCVTPRTSLVARSC